MDASYFKQHLERFKSVYISQSILNGCFYGMRAIFVLYAINQYSLNEAQAIHLFATFMILCYGTSLIGGYIADSGLGVKNALIVGCLLSALGLIGILFPWQDIYFLGLALFSLGSGFLKPNISAALGLLFEDPQDPRKDQAYSFLYVAMNLGSLIAPIICGYIGHIYGWHYGILLISAVFLGTSYFIYKKLQFHPIHKHAEKRRLSYFKLFGISLSLITPLYLVFKFQDYFHSLMGLITIGSLIWLGNIYYQCDLFERKNVIKIMAYIFLFAISCALSEQAGTSLMLFYEKAVNRQLLEMVIPASAFLSINPLMVLIIGPLLLALSYKYLERSKPINGMVKAGCSFMCMSLSFGLLALSTVRSSGLISPLWILGAIFIQTIGELWIAPISFAKISQYAPSHFKSFLMSFWSMAIAYGHYLAGFMAQFSIQKSSVNPNNALEPYQSFFIYLSLLPLFIGIFLLLCQSYRVIKDRINNKKNVLS
jgi:POT family proton-dependent oligopeptide transporter